MKKLSEQLLNLRDKADLERICAASQVNLSEWMSLIECFVAKGFTYSSLSFEWQSKDLKVTEKNQKELADMSKPPEKFLGKAIGFFKPEMRLFYVGHLFEKETEFYCFWFTSSSLDGTEKGSHWGKQPHIHLLSHHYGTGWTAARVKEIFATREKDVLSGEHIKVMKPI